MKISIVDTTLSGDLIGGAQVFLPRLLSGLVQRGHHVKLLTRGSINERVRAAIVGSGASIDTDVLGRPGLIEDVWRSSAGNVNAASPDVYAVSVAADLGWAVLPMLDPTIATITIGHNDEETFYAPVRHYRQFLTRAIGVSEEICDAYVKDCGIRRERVDWIPYGVGTRGREPEETGGPLRLIYVGRFEEEQKRISDVVTLIKRLSAERVEYLFTLVGDGESMPMVRERLAEEIARGSVRLPGWLPSDEVIREMNASDVFVLASAYEGFCISLIEAMANGCTPVVTDIRSGNKQLVREGETGFVVPIGDIEGFVVRIKVLAGDRRRLMSMRNKAWEAGREYSIGRMVENYETCFEQAVGDARSAPRQTDPAFPLMPSCRSRYPLWLRRIKAKAMTLRG